jgi:hypothetical protein
MKGYHSDNKSYSRRIYDSKSPSSTALHTREFARKSKAASSMSRMTHRASIVLPSAGLSEPMRALRHPWLRLPRNERGASQALMLFSSQLPIVNKNILILLIFEFLAQI